MRWTIFIILGILSVALGIVLLLASIWVIVGGDPGVPSTLSSSVIIGVIATGIILLGWPIYVGFTNMHKKLWEFPLGDRKHTVLLEHGYFSGKRKITVDGRVIIRSGSGLPLLTSSPETIRFICDSIPRECRTWKPDLAGEDI